MAASRQFGIVRAGGRHVQHETYHQAMTDPERIEALLDIVDDTRSEQPEVSQALVVIGLAERRGKGFWPTTAGWTLLSDRGRQFDV